MSGGRFSMSIDEIGHPSTPNTFRSSVESLLQDPAALKARIDSALPSHSEATIRLAENPPVSAGASAVLFLLGRLPGKDKALGLYLNKRSAKVRQPGDLCCPGGSIAPGRDRFLAKLLRGPFSPLTRWAHWSFWRRHSDRQAYFLSLLLAAGLRESFEEMRLNPLKVQFLGLLPTQRLVMFQRTIYPLVCWVRGRKRFQPNWEVEKIVYLPLRRLLDPGGYGRLRLVIRDSKIGTEIREFPCFVHREPGGSERLWGATYRITMTFLKRTFDFQPPPPPQLPLFEDTLAADYRTGDTRREELADRSAAGSWTSAHRK
jgi:8-oxo-dGTP pyrophosphatase MutT (NUDIX family)